MLDLSRIGSASESQWPVRELPENAVLRGCDAWDFDLDIDVTTDHDHQTRTRTRNPDSKQAELENEMGRAGQSSTAFALTASSPVREFGSVLEKHPPPLLLSVFPRQLQMDDDSGAAVAFWNKLSWRNLQTPGHKRHGTRVTGCWCSARAILVLGSRRISRLAVRPGMTDLRNRNDEEAYLSKGSVGVILENLACGRTLEQSQYVQRARRTGLERGRKG